MPDRWKTSGPPSRRWGPPQRSVTPQAMPPKSMQCCRGVSAKTALQHPEPSGTQGGRCCCCGQELSDLQVEASDGVQLSSLLKLRAFLCLHQVSLHKQIIQC